MKYVCGACGLSAGQGGYCPSDGTQLAASQDAMLGTEVGRYRIARLLGVGGMGQVYLGVQPTIGSRVAIKVLSNECTRIPELLERFFAEARAVNMIKHESIVSVLDMSQLPDGRPYIIMEFIEGRTLGEIVRDGAAPIGGIVQVATEMLSALGAAHALGIVHRDLKPDNVLVTGEGHAKVLDFGIAKLAPGLGNAMSPRTATGALLGTPAYMAPEQISGAENVDPRTDLYAAGIVLFEAITGRAPFQGSTLYDLMRAHLEQPPPSPRALRPDLPVALEHVIYKALEKDPARRFQSAAEMTHALHDGARDLPADQWRQLSRGGLLPGRPSLDHMRHLTPRDQAHAPTVRASVVSEIPTRPDGSTTRRDPPRRSRAPVIAIAALAAVSLAIVIVIVTRSGDSPTASPGPVATAEPAPIATAPAPQPATAVSPPAPIAVTPPMPAPAPPAPAPAPPAPATAATPPPAPVRTGRPPAPPPAAPVAQQVAPPAPTPPAPVAPVAPVAPAPPAPTQTQTSHAADYNAKSFDPVAYLPKARRLAQSLLPDAELTTFEFDPVFPDGRVDLTMEGRDREYNFRSPSRSTLPAGHVKNIPLDRPCRVLVELTATKITARIVDDDECKAPLVRIPRCSFAVVWAKARAKGVPTDVVARIGWLFDSTWFFDTGLDGSSTDGSPFTLKDDCR